MIVVDSREKKWDHVRAYFEKAEVDYSVKKLDYGDYMVPGSSLSIDRKQNLDELAVNLCSKDSKRFWNEFRNAKKAGIHLVILCEHSKNVREPRDVLRWKSRYAKITGVKLFSAIFRASVAYGVEFRFCDKKHTGQRIVELLEGGQDGEKG